MAKLTLTDISSGYLTNIAYNANNALIETALENTLSRDGTTPNTMSANIDMNGNDITNVDAITTTSLTVGGTSITAQVAAAAASAAAALVSENAASASAVASASSASASNVSAAAAAASAAALNLPNPTVALDMLRVNAGATAYELRTPAQVVSDLGAAVTSGTLGQFAATTSAQLAGVISDETGSGVLVYSINPILTTPNIGTPSAGTLTNCDGTAASLTAGQATAALGLKSATTTVSVSGATAPSSGQVLTATSDAAATWQSPTTASGGLLNTVNFTAQAVALASISNATPAVFTTSTAQQLPEVGSPIQLTTSGALPTGLSLATTYYVSNASGTTYNVCTTYADALAGTNKVATSSAGSGTHTMNSVYVPNPSSSFIEVELWGAGGGSGGVSAAVATSAMLGGDAGGFTRKKILTSALGATETVTIGAGGTAGANTGTNGGTGATSSFGAHCSSTGGTGSQGRTASTCGLPGGTPGVGSGGDVNLRGAPGNSAGTVSAGNGGGGSGGSTTLGGAGLAQVVTSAAGLNAVNNSGSGAGAPVAAGAAVPGAIGGSGRCIVYEYS